MIGSDRTARVTRLPRNPRGFRHRMTPEGRAALDAAVTERARARRIAYTDAALDRHEGEVA